MAMNIVTGNDAGTTLSGTAGGDLIYGFDPNAAYASATIAATRVASGLDQPLYVTAAPGDTSRLFIVEKTGTIKILDLNTGQVLATPFLTVPVNTTSERGLLGLAFDPNYASNGLFYIYRTSPGAENEVLRYQVSGDPNVANGTGPLVLDVGPSTNGNHNAGWLGFGPDGYLYIDSGEVGVPANAQNLTNQLGKILRIDVSSGAGYAIPADNPFVGDGGGTREEIFAYGLRNPWRSSFDSATGTFFIGDVGGSLFEEVNIGQSGANYGWPIAEGVSANPAFVNPIHTYPHGATRIDHRRLCVSRRNRRPERPIFLRRLRDRPAVHLAVRRVELDRDRPHRADPDRRRRDQSCRRRSARTRAATSMSSTSTARSSG